MFGYVWRLVGLRGLSSTTIAAFVAAPVALYSIGMIGKDKLKRSMYGTGFMISQKFKKVPFWDKYVEPALVRNFATVVIAGNALLEGMVSDNDTDSIKDMKKMRQDIKDRLIEYEQAEHIDELKKVTDKLSDNIKRYIEFKTVWCSD